jgi:molecular chaperone DnaJ
MGTEKTHYQVLGVSAEASIDEIRRAYREQMRAIHPDVNEKLANDSQRMTEINLAWKTLSSPQLRRAYDASVSVSSSSFVSSGLRNAEPVISYAPARFPWRGLLIASVVGAVLVLIAHAFTSPGVPRPIDQLLSSGSCVNIDSSLSAVEVSCTEPHDAVVEQLIAFDRSCPLEMGQFKDRQGMGVACVLPVRPVPGVQLPGVPG